MRSPTKKQISQTPVIHLVTDNNPHKPSTDGPYLNRTVYMGLLLAFALILSYVETLIPFVSGVPGVKLGLANLAVALCLYLLGWKEALILTVTKALLGGLLFGNLSIIIYSLSGAILSIFAMIVLKKTGWFHIPVVSAAGGVMHNVGQLLTAMFIVETYGLLYYAPLLIIAGVVTGFVIGISASLILPLIQNTIGKGDIF